jgi:hypothetical protein
MTIEEYVKGKIMGKVTENSLGGGASFSYYIPTFFLIVFLRREG